MWKLEEIQRDLLTLNGYNRMHALGKVRRWINGIFACFLLVAGHRILFLINFPMLAWEVYEALNKKIYINVITTRDFYMHEMPRHYLYLCFFIMILCVYLDLLVSSN